MNHINVNHLVRLYDVDMEESEANSLTKRETAIRGSTREEVEQDPTSKECDRGIYHEILLDRLLKSVGRGG